MSSRVFTTNIRRKRPTSLSNARWCRYLPPPFHLRKSIQKRVFYYYHFFASPRDEILFWAFRILKTTKNLDGRKEKKKENPQRHDHFSARKIHTKRRSRRSSIFKRGVGRSPFFHLYTFPGIIFLPSSFSGLPARMMKREA